jgi:replicative DNA helicase
VVERTPVAICSLEMSKDQLAHRMLCALARVNVHNARTGFLAQADWKELPKAASKLD